MDENFREEQDCQFDSEGQTQEQTQTASEQTTEQMNMQNENSSYRQTYGSSNAYEQTGSGQNTNAYNQQNSQNSMYHGTPGQNMYFGGAFYSSNQHAGYNSQTGYTSAYTNPSGNTAQGTGASTQNVTGYSENVNKAMQKAAEKEKKKSEKMVRSAKKKADKKAKKETDKTVSFLPQENPLIPELSGLDNLKLWYSGRSTELNSTYSLSILKRLGVDVFLHQKVSTMSGGMKKRLSLAICMLEQPDLLLLDEPLAALDLLCKKGILDYLKEYTGNGGSIIVATHEEDALSICNRIYILKDGLLQEAKGTDYATMLRA